jgi:hypothetical protein
MRAMALLFVAGLMAPAIQPVLAGDHEGHGKHWKDRDDQGEDEDEGHYRRHGYQGQCFRAEDIRVIHDYYCPRGLPPGLQKKFYRTGQLPPGWQKKMQPFPYEIEERLPPPPDGCARGYMNGFAVVYQPRTGVIVDIHAVFGH